MKEYVLDANAVLRYFGVGDGLGGNKVRELFEQAERKQVKLSMSVINMGEVLYILLKHVGDERAHSYLRALQHAVTMINADAHGTMDAATVKHRYKLGYADSFAASLALRSRAALVSADPEFEKIGRTLRWIRLPQFVPQARR